MLLGYATSLHSEADPDRRLKAFAAFFADAKCSAANRDSDEWWKLAYRGTIDVWSAIRKLAVGQFDPQSKAQAKCLWKLLSADVPRVMTTGEWFEREGVALILRRVFTSPTSIAVLKEAAGSSFTQRIHVLIHTVVLPLAVNKQLAVRNVAASIVSPMIASLEDGEEVRDEYHAVITSWVCAQLSAADVFVVEGGLQIAIMCEAVSRRLVADHALLVNSLASHEAATVRQLIAEIWGSQGVASLNGLVDAVVDAAADGPWQRVETVLMALHTSMLRLLGSAELTSPGSQAVKRSIIVCSGAVAARHLIAWESSPQFEVRRMAIQALPPLTQLLVRCGGLRALVQLANADDSLWTNAQARTRFTSNLCWFGILQFILEDDVDPSRALNDIADAPAPARIITATYELGESSKCVKAPPSLWSAALHLDAEVAKFAPDYAAVCGDAWLVVPVWAEFALHARQPPHIQCLLLEAIRFALIPEVPVHPMFHFRSSDDFAPPVLEEDGGGVASGATWLSQRAARIPSLKTTVDEATQGKRLAAIRGEPAIVDALSRIFAQLLPKTSTEPAVVHRITDLAMELSGSGIVLPDVVFVHVLERLNVVSPQWKTGEFQAQFKPSASNFDDSDDEDDGPASGGWDDGVNGAGNVASISIDREFLAAQRIVRVFRSRDRDFGASFRTEIDIILQYASPTQSPT